MIESNISDTNNGGSTEACRRGLEAGSMCNEVEMAEIEMGEKTERDEDNTETGGDKGS